MKEKNKINNGWRVMTSSSNVGKQFTAYSLKTEYAWTQLKKHTLMYRIGPDHELFL